MWSSVCDRTNQELLAVKLGDNNWSGILGKEESIFESEENFLLEKERS